MIDREDEGAWTSDEDADDVPKHGHKPGIESGLAREWWFMADWMRKTRGCFTLVEDERFLVDPLRIGPDGNDKWINVSIANKEPARSLWNDDSALVEGHEWRFPMLRDAMLLQSMMAHSDYDAWIKSLVKIGGVKAPKYVHLNMNKPSWSTTLLKPRFSITIPPYMNPKYYEWAFLQEIFQATTLSKDIKTGYTTMIKLVTSKGVDDASIQPVSLKLRFVPQHVGYLRQLAVIRNIRSVVERFNQSGAKSQYLFPDNSPAAPVFHLEQMDLDFSAFSLHPTVLRAIEKLITTSGVSIGLLRLPSDPFNGDFDESTLRTAWASLVCTLFGDIHFRHDSQTERFPTTIDHIDVPWMYTCTELCEPLFMAAKDARRVRSVRIDMNAQLHNRQSTACRYFGSLIGYAFFSAQSASSIESVELGRLAASNRFDESMVDVATSQDALGSLWAKINGLSYSNGASLNKEIVLKRGTMLHPRSKLTEIKIPAPWSAFILFDDSSEPFVDVYAPGFGLCTVDRSDIQNKKRRLCTSQTEQNEDRQADGGSLLQDTRRLRTLAISLWPNRDGHDHQDPTDTNYFSVELPYFIERVGSLIGNSLEGLAVDSQDTNEWVIRSICKCFPHLRQLKLVGGSFGSLGFIMEAYQNDCRITSIELSGTNIPIDQFELFLQFLISDPKGKSTIQQLSVGKDWLQDFRRQTMVLFQRLLQKCRQLSYLDLHVDNCDDRHALQDQHGEFIPGAPLALPNRLAFVSVRNHPTQADLAIAKLDEAVLQLVFEFAGAVKNRNVIVKRNTIIPVIRRLLFDF